MYDRAQVAFRTVLSPTGVDPDHFDRHTALGDARLAKAVFDRIIGQPGLNGGN